jgi:ABC-type phosphate/phosphonate transport system substrate-binding protein
MTQAPDEKDCQSMAQSITPEPNTAHPTARSTVFVIRLTPQMMLVLLLLLSACGGAPEEAGVVEPTATPVPAVLALVFPMDVSEDTDTAALAGEIRRRSDLVVDVRTVDTGSTALDAACEPAEDSIPAAVWLDGLSYAVAAARACGQPVLQVGRVSLDEEIDESDALEATVEAEDASDDETEIIATDEADGTAEPSGDIPDNIFTGLPGVIVVNSDLDAADLTAINENTYCRTDVEDMYSWLLPLMMFRAEGIDLTSSTIAVVDIEDGTAEALLQAVADGQCTMAGLSQADAANLPENVEILRTLPSIPFGVLVMPSELDAATRDAVIEALVTMAEDAEVSGLLTPSLRQERLLPATTEDFAELNNFIASTGLNLAALDQ